MTDRADRVARAALDGKNSRPSTILIADGDISLRSRVRLAIVAAAAIVIAAATLWYFESPAWTLRNMKAAADANDAEALNAYIDYPALRQSFKAEVMARMMTEAQKDKSGFGALGLAFGSAIVGPMIDGVVSPPAVRAALMAKHNQQTLGRAPGGASPLKVPDRPVFVRRNFSEFLVTTKGAPNSGLVFKRHGFSWQLSGVELPPDTK